MKAKNFHVIRSSQPQQKFGLEYTLFIPFEPGATKDEDGYGMYILLHEITTPSRSAPSLVALVSLQLAKTQNKQALATVLHTLNLHLPIPGWILNDRENLLHFKYVFPIQAPAQESAMEVYLTLLAEVVRGLSASFPFIKQVLEGTDVESVTKSIEQAMK